MRNLPISLCLLVLVAFALQAFRPAETEVSDEQGIKQALPFASCEDFQISWIAYDPISGRREVWTIEFSNEPQVHEEKPKEHLYSPINH